MFQKLAHWYFSKNALPYWRVVLTDCLAILGSGYLVAIFTDGAAATALNWKALSLSMLAYLCCYIVGMRLLHTYAGIFRYSSFVDLHRVALANVIGLVLSLSIRV
jgi:FlaA1/EpsC-like NDP-sugar epimerase